MYQSCLERRQNPQKPRRVHSDAKTPTHSRIHSMPRPAQNTPQNPYKHICGFFTSTSSDLTNAASALSFSLLRWPLSGSVPRVSGAVGRPKLTGARSASSCLWREQARRARQSPPRRALTRTLPRRMACAPPRAQSLVSLPIASRITRESETLLCPFRRTLSVLLQRSACAPFVPVCVCFGARPRVIVRCAAGLVCCGCRSVWRSLFWESTARFA